MFSELIVIDDPTPRSGPVNMAIDEVLLSNARSAILRFYRWSAPTVSFGYFVRFTDVCAIAGGRAIVRRWTGGGIVPHGQDLILHGPHVALSLEPLAEPSEVRLEPVLFGVLERGGQIPRGDAGVRYMLELFCSGSLKAVRCS